MAHTDQSNERGSVDACSEAVGDEHLSKGIDKALASGQAVQMRSELDDLPALKAYRMYWRVTLVCFLAAFSAALEGYRMLKSAAVLRLVLIFVGL